MARDSFTERMEQGKLLAQVNRNKGLHTGTSAKGWTYQRAPMTTLDRFYMATYKLEIEYNRYKEWQYAAIAAVESALFAFELEETF